MKRAISNAFSMRKSASTNDVSSSDRRNIYSVYEGGTAGKCSVCNNIKISCNCQHCRGCGAYMVALRSRHHCRMCWRPFCPKCGNKQRVVEFMGGSRPQPSRVCRTCALPQGLMHISSLFDTYGSLRNEEVAPADSNEQSTDHYCEEGHRFRWGLYALLSVIDAPRRCINPSCSQELSYSDTCAKCKMPTVTSTLHEVRGISRMTGSGSNKVDPAAVEVMEETVGREHNSVADRLAASDVDALYNTLLPNHSDNFALHGLREDTWAVRKVFLSRICAALASEWQNFPNMSLALSDTPEATLLRVLRIESLYTVFESPGMVRYVAFAPTAGRKALDRRLASTVHNRQVWSTSSSQNMGIIVPNERAAKGKGGLEMIGEFGATESLLQEVEQATAFTDLINDVLAMMKEGADVVFCGHSTAGSIASLLTARLLIEHTDVACDRLMCVTYGAPLVANRGLTELLEGCPRGNLCRNFQHFVNGSDVMPRLPFLGTFLSAGTLGTAEEPTNMAEVRDLILGWFSANQLGLPLSGAYAQSSGKGKKPKKMLTKEKKTAVSVQELGMSSDAASNVANTYYEAPSSNSSVDGDSDNEDAARTATSTPSAAMGDIFAHTREPFDNNHDSMQAKVSAAGEVSSPLLPSVDVSAFETNDYRNLQVLDPFGCYNILWRGRDMYQFSDNPCRTLALLSDRNSMRVLLQDHLMSSYDRALVEYMNAAA